MNRRDLIKGISLAGLASLIPFNKAKATINRLAKTDVSCILIPSETAGPYPWPSSGNALPADSPYNRSDIKESQSGIPLDLTLTLVDLNNSCSPVVGAAILIWHCDKDGHYSQYNTTQNGGDYTAYTYFRGFQYTDSNGQVNFSTIFPGWYIPRSTHIHVQVFLNSVLSATTQLAFADKYGVTTGSNNIYTSNSSLYTKGASPYPIATDQVFGTADGGSATDVDGELITLTSNSTTGGYDGTITMGIAVPTTGVINLTPETGGQFTLNQNYPNPFNTSTTLSFILNYAAVVKIDIYEMHGKKVMELLNSNLAAGTHTVVLERQSGSTSLSPGSYLYQITTENGNGIFKKVKVMTVN